MRKIDEDFIVVRDYIDEHKHSDVDKVSEETGVKKQIIIHLLKEGRLIIDDPEGEGGGMLQCEACKKPINTGRLCKECKEKLSTTMQKSIGERKPGGSQSAASQNFKGSAKIK